MLDIGWSELVLIGIVALIVVGPKDLPGMFRQLGRFTAKARGMAREFSRAMEDAAREAGVDDVAKDLKAVTSKKSLGLDALEKAADRFEKWEPKLPQPARAGAEATAAAPGLVPDAEAAKAAAGTDPVGQGTRDASPAAADPAPALAAAPAATQAAIAQPAATQAAAVKVDVAPGEAAKPKRVAKTRKPAAEGGAKAVRGSAKAAPKTESKAEAAEAKPAKAPRKKPSAKTAAKTADKTADRTAASDAAEGTGE